MNDTVYNREETYERELKEYQANQPHQLSMFDIPEPTEEEIFGDKVERLKEDIWLQFQGTTASHLSIHEAMLDKWFGRVKGSHFTRAFREMKEEGRIANLSGPPSHHDTLIAFKA